MALINGNQQNKGFGSQKQGINPGYGIRSIYQPTDKQRQTLKFVYQDRYLPMKMSPDRQDAQKQWDRWEKQWEGFRIPRKEDEWQSNHVAPVTFSIVETALSEMIRQNMRPLILPRGVEDQAKAVLMQHIWDYSWYVSDSDLLLYEVIKDLLIYGTAITQEYYRKEKRLIGNTVIGADKKETTKEKEDYVYDDVCGELVKLQDFFVDEYARGFTGPYAARDCIRRYIMNIEDFKLMYRGSVWDQFGNADKVRPGGDTEYYEFYKPPQGINQNDQVEVLHYWSIKPKDRFVILANDVVIRDDTNPYKHKQLPFARAVDVKRIHKFYGKGEPEILESIQSETDTLRRMIIDRNHLDIDKMFLVSNKLGLNDEDLMARPHGMIPTDDVNGAKAVEYGDIPRSVEISLQHLEDDGTISTGINPRAQALPVSGTATEAAILKESTLRRIETKLWLLRKEYLIRIGQLRLANILQFYSQPILEKIVGEAASQEYQQEISQLQNKGLLLQQGNDMYKMSYRKIPIKGKQLDFDNNGQITQTSTPGYTFFDLKPDYFMPIERGGYDIRFDAGPNVDISKPLMQQKNLELFDRFLQIVQLFPGSYDPVKLGDMILKDYDKNPDDLKPDAPQGNQDDQQLQTFIQLASLENQQLMKGIAVPATPYAPPVHTRLHIEFMHSPPFQNLENNSKIIKNFTTHVMGEIIAQQGRDMQGIGAPGSEQQGQPLSNQSLQPQQQPQATSISQGITNRPNGMAQPSTKLSDIMPNFQSGGNRNVS